MAYDIKTAGLALSKLQCSKNMANDNWIISEDTLTRELRQGGDLCFAASLDITGYQGAPLSFCAHEVDFSSLPEAPQGRHEVDNSITFTREREKAVFPIENALEKDKDQPRIIQGNGECAACLEYHMLARIKKTFAKIASRKKLFPTYKSTLLFRGNEGEHSFNVVGTNIHQLTQLSIPNQKQSQKSFDFQILYSDFLAIESMFKALGLGKMCNLMVHITEDVVQFSFGNNFVQVQRETGSYPDFSPILERECHGNIMVETKPIINALKSAKGLLAKCHNCVVIGTHENEISLGIFEYDGLSQKIIPVQGVYRGIPFVSVYNARYFLEVLSVLEKTAYLEHNKDSGMIRVSGDGITNVTMPIDGTEVEKDALKFRQVVRGEKKEVV